jgi:hypothetical protein
MAGGELMNDSFLIAAFIGLGAAVSARWMNVRTGRIVFWVAAAFTCLSVFFMAYPDDWQSGLAMSLFVGFAMVATAYVNTDFVRVRGRSVSLFSDSDDIDDYGGGLTAKKAWWMSTLGVGMLVLIAVAYYANGSELWIPAGAGLVIALAGMSFGYRDASTARSIAAGQRVQLGLMAVLTTGAFLLFYLAAYCCTRRWSESRQAYGQHVKRRF